MPLSLHLYNAAKAAVIPFTRAVAVDVRSIWGLAAQSAALSV